MLNYLKVTCGVLIWAVINGLVIKGVTVPSAVLGTFMSLVGMAIFIPYLISVKPNLNGDQTKLLCFLGIACALNNSFFYAALKMTEVYNAALVHYFAAVLAILWIATLPFMKERLDWISTLCVLLGVSGLIIMTGSSWMSHEKWLYFAFISAVFYSFEIVLSRMVGVHGVSPYVSSFTKLSFQAAIMPFVGVFVLRQQFAWPTGQVSNIILAGVLLALSFVLVFGGLKTVPSKHFAVLGYFDRLGAILIAMSVWGERFGWNIIIGGALILIAELPIIFMKKESPAPAAESANQKEA